MRTWNSCVIDRRCLSTKTFPNGTAGKLNPPDSSFITLKLVDITKRNPRFHCGSYLSEMISSQLLTWRDVSGRPDRRCLLPNPQLSGIINTEGWKQLDIFKTSVCQIFWMYSRGSWLSASELGRRNLFSVGDGGGSCRVWQNSLWHDCQAVEPELITETCVSNCWLSEALMTITRLQLKERLSCDFCLSLKFT